MRCSLALLSSQQASHPALPLCCSVYVSSASCLCLPRAQVIKAPPAAWMHPVNGLLRDTSLLHYFIIYRMRVSCRGRLPSIPLGGWRSCQRGGQPWRRWDKDPQSPGLQTHEFKPGRFKSRMRKSHFIFLNSSNCSGWLGFFFPPSQAVAVVGAGCASAPPMQRDKGMSAREGQGRTALLTSCHAHYLSGFLMLP